MRNRHSQYAVLASKRPHLSNPMCSLSGTWGGWMAAQMPASKMPHRQHRSILAHSSLFTLHSSCSLMCGIFEADVLLHVLIPMFRFATHGVTEMQPLRGYVTAASSTSPTLLYDKCILFETIPTAASPQSLPYYMIDIFSPRLCTLCFVTCVFLLCPTALVAGHCYPVEHTVLCRTFWPAVAVRRQSGLSCGALSAT